MCIGAGVGPLLKAGVAATAGVGAEAGVGALYSASQILVLGRKNCGLTQGVDSAFHPVLRGEVQPSFIPHAAFVLPGVAPPQLDAPPVGATFLPGVAPPQVLVAPPPLA